MGIFDWIVNLKKCASPGGISMFRDIDLSGAISTEHTLPMK
ncbi:Uncharacterised protein [Trueperella bialowiezensis]|uniref:Uncharacterized protein n=1 Tax=Trueperella bialowiezensis TaxID=312285 RepID=A0A448PDS0_9ACTO|nr:Uncharacterised protein [Trueperella bialowiezensis]